MSEYFPVLVTIGSIVAAIICVQVFYTFWGPVNRKFSGPTPEISRDVQLGDLKDSSVNVHFKAGPPLAEVIVVGYTSNWGSPFEFKQFLILKDRSGKQYYARVSEIQCFERLAGQP